jgi:hypothetical protein
MTSSSISGMQLVARLWPYKMCPCICHHVLKISSTLADSAAACLAAGLGRIPSGQNPHLSMTRSVMLRLLNTLVGEGEHSTVPHPPTDLHSLSSGLADHDDAMQGRY